MTSPARQQTGPFRYDGLAQRPRVQPGAVVLCGVCQTPHALAPDPLTPTPALLYYHCAAGRAAPAAQVRHLGALAGWLVDGLAPLPPSGDGAPAPAPGLHPHACPTCARTWLHPDPACQPRGMTPRRCGRCQRRLAATLARWAHVAPENGAAAPARHSVRRTAQAPRSGGATR